MDAGQRVLAISCNRDCLVVILLAALGSRAMGVVGLVGLVTVIATITAFAMASPSRASDETSAARIASAAANNARSVRADCMLYMRGFNARIAMSGGRSCSRYARGLSAWTGEDWQTAQQPRDAPLTPTCKLAHGSARVQVWDSGMKLFGHEACRALRHHGFTRAYV